jgi:hypothetical protein
MPPLVTYYLYIDEDEDNWVSCHLTADFDMETFTPKGFSVKEDDNCPMVGSYLEFQDSQDNNGYIKGPDGVWYQVYNLYDLYQNTDFSFDDYDYSDDYYDYSDDYDPTYLYLV